jgi:hypothetical protein
MAKVLEMLQPFLARLVAYEVYLVYGWLLVLTALLIAVIVRQRRVRKLSAMMTANFENVRAKLEDATAQNKRLHVETATNLGKLLKDLALDQQRLGRETAQAATHADEIAGAMREQINEVQNAIMSLGAKGGGDEGSSLDLTTRLEELADEMAWSHRYCEELKILEKAVLNLVGPEKMRHLMEKEKTDASRAAREEFSRKL